MNDADRQALVTLMTRVTFIIQGHTQERTRVRTGNLRRSWATEVESTGARGYVGTTVRYAPYQKNKPLVEGVADSRDQIRAELEAVGREWLERMKREVES